MKEFRDLVLCKEPPGGSSTREIEVSLWEGKLSFSAVDYGPYVKAYWGDYDYEFWYWFDETETRRLLEAIGGLDDPETALQREFSGTAGCIALEVFCRKHGITYRFESYV